MEELYKFFLLLLPNILGVVVGLIIFFFALFIIGWLRINSRRRSSNFSFMPSLKKKVEEVSVESEDEE